MLVSGTAQLEFGMRAVLVAFNEHKVDVTQMRQQLAELRFSGVAQLTDVCPAATGRDDYLFGAGFAVLMTVFTRVINIEIVMCVFNGCHTHTTTPQLFNEFDHKRGLAGVLEAGYPEDLQGLGAQAAHQPAAATDLPGKIPQGR